MEKLTSGRYRDGHRLVSGAADIRDRDTHLAVGGLDRLGHRHGVRTGNYADVAGCRGAVVDIVARVAAVDVARGCAALRPSRRSYRDGRTVYRVVVVDSARS